MIGDNLNIFPRRQKSNFTEITIGSSGFHVQEGLSDERLVSDVNNREPVSGVFVAIPVNPGDKPARFTRKPAPRTRLKPYGSAARMNANAPHDLRQSDRQEMPLRENIRGMQLNYRQRYCIPPTYVLRPPDVPFAFPSTAIRKYGGAAQVNPERMQEMQRYRISWRYR